MIIRNGVYTVYKGIEMTVSEHYGHGLSQDIDENYRLISYANTNEIIDGFKFDENNSTFYKNIKISELDNAFNVITKAIYKGIYFFMQSDPKEEYVKLNSNESSNFEKIGYQIYQINDEKKVSEDQLYNSKYFRGYNGFNIRVNIKELDEIWEERTKSKYNLPMPDGIEIKKIIKHRNLN